MEIVSDVQEAVASLPLPEPAGPQEVVPCVFGACAGTGALPGTVKKRHIRFLCSDSVVVQIPFY